MAGFLLRVRVYFVSAAEHPEAASQLRPRVRGRHKQRCVGQGSRRRTGRHQRIRRSNHAVRGILRYRRMGFGTNATLSFDEVHSREPTRCPLSIVGKKGLILTVGTILDGTIYLIGGLTGFDTYLTSLLMLKNYRGGDWKVLPQNLNYPRYSHVAILVPPNFNCTEVA